jgi:hypothetical protein
MSDLMNKLTEDCVVMNVKLKKWGGSKSDKSSSALLAETYNGQEAGFANASMKLLPPEYRKRLQNSGIKVGAALKEVGIPFNGGYLIKASEYQDVKGKTDKEIEGVMLVVDEIIQHRVNIESWAKSNLGDKYTDGLIPPDADIRAAFKPIVNVISLGVPPISMNQADRSEIQQQLEKEYKDSIDAALATVKDMLAETKGIIDAVNAGDKKVMRSERWEHIKEELQRVKKMNLSMEGFDAAADSVTAIISSIQKFKSSDMKDSPSIAQTVQHSVSAAESVLAQF